MRELTQAEQQLMLELDNFSLAFLAKPSALVLKDDWLKIYSDINGEAVVWNCPDFQKLLALTEKQYNVLNVLYTTPHGTICEVDTGVQIPARCFRKDMTTAPLMKGE